MQEDNKGGQTNSSAKIDTPPINSSVPGQPTQEVTQSVSAPADTVEAAKGATASQEGSLFVANDESSEEDSPGVARADAVKASKEPSYSWEASEFVHHQKSFTWFALLFVVAVVIISLIYFLTKDIISCVVVGLGTIVISFYAAQAPKQVTYEVSTAGIKIGARFYPYLSFKSYAVIQEDAFTNIIFLPQKRFAPITSIYYDPKDEALIVDRLSQVLPMDDYKYDALDRFMRQIRF